jgi:hypothetical protein
VLFSVEVAAASIPQRDEVETASSTRLNRNSCSKYNAE